jgi:hypothetical protein
MKFPTSAEETGSTARALRAALREPFVHFLALGLALFAVYGAANRGPASKPVSHQVELTLDDLRKLQIGFASKWQRPPTPQEMAGLLEARIREEILYREALAMGLDKDDTIVKRRMVQKMEFLAEDVSGAREPKAHELRARFDANPGRFARPGLVTFRHLYFSPDRRGARAHDDAVQALAKLAGRPHALLGFNMGVEIGQLGFIFLVLAPRALVPAPSDPLAPLGRGASRLRRRDARRVLDDPAHGDPVRMDRVSGQPGAGAC